MESGCSWFVVCRGVQSRMEEFRLALVEKQLKLLNELDKIGRILAILDAPEVAVRDGALARQVDDFIHNLSTESREVSFVSPAGRDLSTVHLGGTNRQKAQGNPKPALVIEKVKMILLNNNRPMTRTELLRELSESGIIIGGYNPSKVLGTTLWRARADIINLDGYGYWVRARPLPNQRYHPSGGVESEAD